MTVNSDISPAYRVIVQPLRDHDRYRTERDPVGPRAAELDPGEMSAQLRRHLAESSFVRRALDHRPAKLLCDEEIALFVASEVTHHSTAICADDA